MWKNTQNCVVLYICVCLCLFACSVGNGQNVAHFTPFLGWLRMRCVTEVCDMYVTCLEQLARKSKKQAIIMPIMTSQIYTNEYVK